MLLSTPSEPLALGTTRPTEDAPWAEALTVVATVAPGEELRLATVSGGGSAALTTFVFPLNVHPGLGGAGAAALEPVRLRHFPLAAEHTPAFCTQGVGGRLSHLPLLTTGQSAGNSGRKV